jgi:hypothetical protein
MNMKMREHGLFCDINLFVHPESECDKFVRSLVNLLYFFKHSCDKNKEILSVMT